MRISTEDAAAIKGCKGVYPVSDVARHFGVAIWSVKQIWAGVRHKDVKPTEAPVIEVNRVPDWLVRDVLILWERKYSPSEIARTLRITQAGVLGVIPKEES